MNTILIGAVSGAVGIKGEIKIKSFAGSPDRFKKVSGLVLVKHSRRGDCRENETQLQGLAAGQDIQRKHGDVPDSGSRHESHIDEADSNSRHGSHIDEPDSNSRFGVERAVIRNGVPVLKLAGIDDRNAAERLRGCEVYMDESELEELPEDTHYVRDLIGMTVIDNDTGETLGELVDVLTDRPQDLYVVRRADDNKDDEAGVRGAEAGTPDDYDGTVAHGAETGTPDKDDEAGVRGAETEVSSDTGVTDETRACDETRVDHTKCGGTSDADNRMPIGANCMGGNDETGKARAVRNDDILIPAVADFILDIDEYAHVIKVHLIEGMK